MQFHTGIVAPRVKIGPQSKSSETANGTCATASKISADADARMVA